MSREPGGDAGRPDGLPLVVVDDHFPTLGTGFRLAEFSWLLRRGIAAEVLTTVPELERHLESYSGREPEIWRRVRAFDEPSLAAAGLAYLMFLNNAAHHLSMLERHAVPFVLELYPGGGLHLGDPDAEAKLERVLTSPMLRHVITTQPMVTARVHGILETARADAAHVGVTEILGVVVDPVYLSPGPGLRSAYGVDAGATLSLCFVAHRYTADGRDKGFPIFVEVVRRLADAGIAVHGHVIGGFDAADVAGEADAALLTFHGTLSATQMRIALVSVDMVVSPTQADVLAPGAFDGFPTGGTVEAMLCGAAAVVTDPRAQNRLLVDGRDVVIVRPDAAEIAARIIRILQHPGELARIAQAGLATARRAYSVDAQLWRRRAVLEDVLRDVAAEGVVDDVSAIPGRLGRG